MPRRARLVLPGVAHHVTQRGNNRQQVFFSDDDRAAYMDRMFNYCAEYGTRVLAWCLMPNHIHVVAVPARPQSLARVFGRLQADYARYMNLKLRAVGQLWQERYYSCPMDDGHTIRAIAYVANGRKVGGSGSGKRRGEGCRWASERGSAASRNNAGAT